MFAEPTVRSVTHLFNTPGLGMELLGAGLLALGVVGYLMRVAWIALSNARNMEMESLQAVPATPVESTLAEPYCSG